MRHPLRTTATILGLSMLHTQAHADDMQGSWRLFVTDHGTSKITALDLEKPSNTWTFEVEGPAKLYPSPTGETVIAVQMDDDLVSFIDTGVELDRHNDHGDFSMNEPTLIDQELSGDRPFHVILHDGMVTTNFDQGGYTETVELSDLQDGEITPVRFVQNRPHHGYATPMGEFIISSVASDEKVEDDELPPRVGLAVHDQNGAVIGDVATCTDLHGEAFSGEYLATGCVEGVLTLRETDGPPEFRMLPYPDGFPDEMTGTLLGAKAAQVFLGDHGDDAVVVVDPEQAPHYQRIELPFRHVDFVLDPARPEFAYILTEDGTLHQLNMQSTEIEQSASMTQAYSMDGDWNDPRPRLSMAGDRIVLTDPSEERVRVVDAATLEVAEDIPVEGLPYNIATVGSNGVRSDSESDPLDNL